MELDLQRQHVANHRLLPRKIDFGCEIPSTQISELDQQGFEALERQLQKGDHEFWNIIGWLVIASTRV